MHVQRAARALARYFDEALRPVGLTNGQFSLLMSLNRPEPPPIGPVAALLAMDRTTLTAALKPLERRGLVRVQLHPGDRRSRILILTAKGRRQLARAVPVWERAHHAIEEMIPNGDPESLRENLRALSSLHGAAAPSLAPGPAQTRVLSSGEHVGHNVHAPSPPIQIAAEGEKSPVAARRSK